MKPRFPGLQLALAVASTGLLAGLRDAGAYEDGAPPGHTGGFGEPDCGACHSDYDANPDEGNLLVEGLPGAYRPGESYDVTIILQHPLLASGGFQLAFRDRRQRAAGEWRIEPENLQLVTKGEQVYLQHARANREAGKDGSVRWTATWRAPALGEPVVVSVAANASNDDASALGDRVYVREFELAALPGDGAAGDQ